MKQSQIEDVRKRVYDAFYHADGKATQFLKDLVDKAFDEMIRDGQYKLTDAEEEIKHFSAYFRPAGFELNLTLSGK